MAIPRFGFSSPVRVCDVCYQAVTLELARSVTASATIVSLAQQQQQQNQSPGGGGGAGGNNRKSHNVVAASPAAGTRPSAMVPGANGVSVAAAAAAAGAGGAGDDDAAPAGGAAAGAGAGLGGGGGGGKRSSQTFKRKFTMPSVKKPNLFAGIVVFFLN